jgi:hypothetical protein
MFTYTLIHINVYIYTQNIYIQAYRYLGYAVSIKQLLVISTDNLNQNEIDELYLSLSSSQYHLAAVLLYIGSTGTYRYLCMYICIHIYIHVSAYHYHSPIIIF